MFGYMEHNHTVVSSCTIVRGGKEMQLDVRRPVMPSYSIELSDYLVLTHKGEPIYMKYDGWASKEEAMAFVVQDHARLIAEPDVALKQLHWQKYIQADTGYGRNGSITMY